MGRRARGTVRRPGTCPAGGISVFARPDARTAGRASCPAGEQVRVVGRDPWVHVRTRGRGRRLGRRDRSSRGSRWARRRVPRPGPDHRAAVPRSTGVVEKQRSPLRLGPAPVVGALGGLVAIVGAALPWLQTVGPPARSTRSGSRGRARRLGPARRRRRSSSAARRARSPAIGVVVSLIAGGGHRPPRSSGSWSSASASCYVLQQQDFLTSDDRGLGHRAQRVGHRRLRRRRHVRRRPGHDVRAQALTAAPVRPSSEPLRAVVALAGWPSKRSTSRARVRAPRPRSHPVAHPIEERLAQSRRAARGRRCTPGARRRWSASTSGAS